jgi:hypothetical protein
MNLPEESTTPVRSKGKSRWYSSTRNQKMDISRSGCSTAVMMNPIGRKAQMTGQGVQGASGIVQSKQDSESQLILARLMMKRSPPKHP